MATTPALILYWLSSGGSGQFSVPPLQTIASVPPLPTAVNLFAANMDLMSDGTVGLTVPDSIWAVIRDGEAKALQQQGIKVLLSIMNNVEQQLGWSTLTDVQSTQFASAVADFLQASGLDGIDIDDEGLGYMPSPSQFYQTVSQIRQRLPTILLSNAVYDSQDWEKYSQYPDLITKVNYCCTMAYSDSFSSIVGNVQYFQQAGIPLSRLCAGVQAGPANTPCDNGQFTSMATAQQVAEWARTNAMGMMLFTFSQDILEFTACPQKQPQYKYPNANDHSWQRAIAAALYAHTPQAVAP